MSFYGNSYTYLAETFNRVVMSNLGLDSTEFANIINESVDIRAAVKDGAIQISSGNKWIGLLPIDDGSNQGFSIYHNAPSDQEEDQILIGTENVDDLPTGVTDASECVKEAKFGQYIKVPVITYDKAGHIVTPDSPSQSTIIYFKLPEDPTPSLEDKIKDLEKSVDDKIKVLTESVGDAVEDIGKTAKEFKDTYYNLVVDTADLAQQAKSLAESADSTAQSAYTTATTVSGQFTTHKEDIQKQMSNYIKTVYSAIEGYESRIKALENKHK